jgi:hypothetical protein
MNGWLVGLCLGALYWAVTSWELSNSPDMRPFLRYDEVLGFVVCLVVGSTFGALIGVALKGMSHPGSN